VGVCVLVAAEALLVVVVVDEVGRAVVGSGPLLAYGVCGGLLAVGLKGVFPSLSLSLFLSLFMQVLGFSFLGKCFLEEWDFLFCGGPFVWVSTV